MDLHESLSIDKEMEEPTIIDVLENAWFNATKGTGTLKHESAAWDLFGDYGSDSPIQREKCFFIVKHAQEKRNGIRIEDGVKVPEQVTNPRTG